MDRKVVALFALVSLAIGTMLVRFRILGNFSSLITLCTTYQTVYVISEQVAMLHRKAPFLGAVLGEFPEDPRFLHGAIRIDKRAAYRNLST